MTAPLLVSCEWLAGHTSDADVRVADVRWSLVEKDKGRTAYRQAHIPGAVFLDVDTDLAAPRGQGPGRHPLPAPGAFAAAMSRAGIGAATHVVAYDFGDGSTAARLWWLLRYFGHERASVLDGGMARWVAEGHAVETDVRSYASATFVPAPRPERVVDAAAVDRLRADPRALVLDVRMPERYEGRREPIDPVAGHIPGAKNLPYTENLSADGRFKSFEALRAMYGHLDPSRVVVHCGSGVTACHTLLALDQAGLTGGALFVGSWGEWCRSGRSIGAGDAP